MIIASVKIENFRGFKLLELDFSKTHALVGENGCGKTAVLEAIALVTSSGQPHLHEQDFNNEDLGDIRIEVTYDKPFLIKIPDGYSTKDILCQKILLTAHRREKAAPGKALSDPFVIERYAVPIIYSAGAAPLIDVGDISVSIPGEVKKTTNGYESPRASGSPFRFTQNRLTLQNDTVNLPDVFYFNRERENQTKVGFSSLLSKIAKDLNWRYRKDWNQSEVEDKWYAFYNLVISTVENPKKDRIITPLRNKMTEITGTDFSNLELGLLDVEQPFSKTFFSQREGTNQIEQSRFGSGISILLAYCLLNIISNLSKNEIIFLIDEPELHLHPQLQYSLLAEFIKSDSQTIYTTQSDCLINIGNWESITRFNNDFEASPQSDHLDSNLDGQPVRQHLDEVKQWHKHKSVFFREDNQLFFAKKCLLVEGPAEKYGLPILAVKCGMAMDSLTIISCNGKEKMHFYQLMCRAFNIPYYTLFDLDGKPDTDPSNKRPIDCSLTGAVNHFADSFEKILGISGGAHKTSDLFARIDTITVAEIPKEVKDIITSINKWQ